jgi:hypothetical protein
MFSKRKLTITWIFADLRICARGVLGFSNSPAVGMSDYARILNESSVVCFREKITNYFFAFIFLMLSVAH